MSLKQFLISGIIFCSMIPSMTFAAPFSLPNIQYWNKQWYLRQIHAPEGWAVTTGSHAVIVAVLDGGVDITHPDLVDNIWKNTKEILGDGIDNDEDGFIDDVHGWNFVTNSGNVRPVFKAAQMEEAWSHGTMVASLIGAKGREGGGMAGVDWNVQIMPLVVLNADGEGSTAGIIKAIRYAVNHGASVINLSLVGYEYDENLESMIHRAAQAGVVIVAATGNDDENMAGINIDKTEAYPVCFDSGKANEVLGVGGTDTLDQKAPYANYGQNCTDVSAPAQSLFVGRPTFPHDTAPTSTVPAYLGDMTGTSLAAPLVSGLAALVKSAHPEWTAKQIRDQIINTSDSIEDNLTADQKGKVGKGRINVARALGVGQTEVAVVKSSTFPRPPNALVKTLVTSPTWQTWGWMARDLIGL